MSLIDRQLAIDAVNALPKWPDAVSAVCLDYADVISVLQDTEKLPSAQPEIIYCKDCKKHGVKFGIDENRNMIWKEDACPLIEWREKAQGHEFDYQFCVYAERREDG